MICFKKSLRSHDLKGSHTDTTNNKVRNQVKYRKSSSSTSINVSHETLTDIRP